MKLSLSALLLVFSFSLSSCEKEDPKCDYVSGPPQEFLDYWYFPQDSYWVYELQGAPGIYDTVTVVSAEAKFYKPKEEFAPQVPCTMIYKQSLAHSNDSIFIRTTRNPEGLEKYETLDGSLYVDHIYNISGFPLSHPIFNLPVEEGRTLASNMVMADTSLVEVETGKYVETVEIQNTNAAPSGQGTTISSLNFSKNVGITKRVYANGQVWVLVDYFINE